MPEVRWVEPERFHLTLRFIGAVDDAVATEIATVLQHVEAPSFALTLAGVGHFTNTACGQGSSQTRL